MTTETFPKISRFLESRRSPRRDSSDKTGGVPVNTMFDLDVGPRFLRR
ncbi:MAG TPA: hypothetical protein VFZ86_00245 [Thermoleophilia bacterium]|nr:hypothetical protein [Thermoleophilia bacterium]